MASTLLHGSLSIAASVLLQLASHDYGFANEIFIEKREKADSLSRCQLWLNLTESVPVMAESESVPVMAESE
jgi:hypothetical protein